jgi:hypothetical protein
LNLVSIQEFLRAASVLAGNQVHLFEDANGTQRNVLKISNRSSDYVKLPVLAIGWLQRIKKTSSCWHKRSTFRNLKMKPKEQCTKSVRLSQAGRERVQKSGATTQMPGVRGQAPGVRNSDVAGSDQARSAIRRAGRPGMGYPPQPHPVHPTEALFHIRDHLGLIIARVMW